MSGALSPSFRTIFELGHGKNVKMRMDMTISRYEDHHGNDNGSKEDMKKLEIPKKSLKAIQMMEVTVWDVSNMSGFFLLLI